MTPRDRRAPAIPDLDLARAANTERVAKSLIACGLGIGDRIGCWSPMTEENLAISLAAFRVGLTVVRFAAECDAATVYPLLEAIRPRMVFVRAFCEGVQYPALLKSMSVRLSEPPVVIVHGREARFERLLPGGWLAFLESGNAVGYNSLAEREAQAKSTLGPDFDAAILAPLTTGEVCTRLRREDVQVFFTATQAEYRSIA
jgi:acyl-CoA synthetase (AMP-forming)/AMP-acid ligase II